MSNFEGAMDNARHSTETLCQIIENLEAEIAELRAGQGRRPKIVTAEQVEAAAGGLAWRLNEWEDGQIVWESPEDIAEEIAACKPLAHVALTAAGLLIEGGHQ